MSERPTSEPDDSEPTPERQAELRAASGADVPDARDAGGIRRRARQTGVQHGATRALDGWGCQAPTSASNGCSSNQVRTSAPIENERGVSVTHHTEGGYRHGTPARPGHADLRHV